MQVLAAILILSILVILHELGHLLVALWAKIKVEEFGLGYPPRLWRVMKKHGIEFSLNAIPFGGFVRLSGEDAQQATGQSGEFLSAPIGWRLAVLLAGVGVNAVVGVGLLCFVFFSTGVPTRISDARIGYVQPDSPAQAGGLAQYDSIDSIQTDTGLVQITSPTQVREVVNQHYGQTVTLFVRRDCQTTSCDGSSVPVMVKLRTQAEVGPDKGTLGVGFLEAVYIHYPFPASVLPTIKASLTESLQLTKLILSALGQMVTGLLTQGKLAQELAGPVGIVHAVGTQNMLSGGWQVILSFAGALSVNLAIMNVLPIPPLDGGKVVLTLLAKIWGKRGQKIDLYANYVGYFMLLGLILLVTARDIWRIVIPYISWLQ